jgi:hypothetical protein
LGKKGIDMSYNTLNIEIRKPYSSSDDRLIEIDNLITLNLNKNTFEALYEQMDNELYYGETREDLLDKIEELESELRDYKGT